MTIQNEQNAHIEQSQNEVRRFCAETRQPMPAIWPVAIGGSATLTAAPRPWGGIPPAFETSRS